MALCFPNFALVICLSLLMQECFVQVQMGKVPGNKRNNVNGSHNKKHGHSKDKQSDKVTQEKDHKKPDNPNEYQWVWLNDDMDDLRLQPQKQQTSSRRGWINSVFKAVKFGGKVATVTTSIAGLANSIFRAIAGCCTDFPDACTYRDEFLALKNKIAQKSQRADELEEDAQNIQVYTNYSINAFEDIIDQLNEIENTQEEFLSSISPEVSIALNTETSRIKKIIKEKNEKGEAVQFLEISSLYESALDNALSIGFPIVGLVIPFGQTIYKFAVKKKAASMTATVESETSVKLEDPKISSPHHKQGRTSRWMSRGVTHYQARVKNIKQKLNQKFGKAVNIASNVYSGFKVALDYVSTGLNIYMIISSYESCKQRRDEAKKARDELLEASKYFDETEVKLNEAKSIMQQSFRFLRGNITHESTLGVIENIKTMVEGISSPSPELIQVAIDLQTFVVDIKEVGSLKGTYRLEENLIDALRKIPFTVKCYTNKVKMVKYVMDSCKEGISSFDDLYDKGKALFDFGDDKTSDSAENCARKIGFRYINKKDLSMGWKEVAKKGNFHELCLLNDKTKQETACGHLRDGYDTKVIAEKMKITEDDAKALTKDCPATLELSPREKEQVCNLKDVFDNQKVAKLLEHDIKLVEATKC
ncbi:uncharacterized protein LOC116307653 [Actinia tenebrosa]|uniref:Uncharacterized protein LOC116307653 n=1 Tax=Actinia tenebrosa TaxID=6105 RepID=A0A6P8J1K9_ACTTE|nr:uncharacterized protein LOC116307653 [Actinia tenebrosa]